MRQCCHWLRADQPTGCSCVPPSQHCCCVTFHYLPLQGQSTSSGCRRRAARCPLRLFGPTTRPRPSVGGVLHLGPEARWLFPALLVGSDMAPAVATGGMCCVLCSAANAARRLGLGGAARGAERHDAARQWWRREWHHPARQVGLMGTRRPACLTGSCRAICCVPCTTPLGAVSTQGTPPALLCRENTVEKVAVQQLPAGEVLITVAGASVSDWLPLPATYALVVQGNFRCGALSQLSWGLSWHPRWHAPCSCVHEGPHSQLHACFPAVARLSSQMQSVLPACLRHRLVSAQGSCIAAHARSSSRCAVRCTEPFGSWQLHQGGGRAHAVCPQS